MRLKFFVAGGLLCTGLFLGCDTNPVMTSDVGFTESNQSEAKLTFDLENNLQSNLALYRTPSGSLYKDGYTLLADGVTSFDVFSNYIIALRPDNTIIGWTQSENGWCGLDINISKYRIDYAYLGALSTTGVLRVKPLSSLHTIWQTVDYGIKDFLISNGQIYEIRPDNVLQVRPTPTSAIIGLRTNVRSVHVDDAYIAVRTFGDSLYVKQGTNGIWHLVGYNVKDFDLARDGKMVVLTNSNNLELRANKYSWTINPGLTNGSWQTNQLETNVKSFKMYNYFNYRLASNNPYRAMPCIAILKNTGELKYSRYYSNFVAIAGNVRDYTINNQGSNVTYVMNDGSAYVYKWTIGSTYYGPLFGVGSFQQW